MKIERVKYIIWAKNTPRAVAFYTDVFGGKVTRQNEHIPELDICGTTLAIHSGGEDETTWTGLGFQVEDVIAGAAEIVAAGGLLRHEPMSDNPGEPPHLAMCADPEGNQIMLFRKR
jgi:catechol 2,3-dioxygenase-like lactoylglutathione lyase family enzyme